MDKKVNRGDKFVEFIPPEEGIILQLDSPMPFQVFLFVLELYGEYHCACSRKYVPDIISGIKRQKTWQEMSIDKRFLSEIEEGFDSAIINLRKQEGRICRYIDNICNICGLKVPDERCGNGHIEGEVY